MHRGNEAVEVSIDRLKDRLEKISEDLPDTPYLDEALQYIEHERASLSLAINARKQLVRFVKTFIHSENVARELWRETSASSAKGSRAKKFGYSKKHRLIDGTKISNPLLFLEAYSTKKRICEAESAWIYYNLTFDLTGAESHE